MEAGAARVQDLRPVLSGADVLEMQEAVTQVRVDESLVTIAADRATHAAIGRSFFRSFAARSAGVVSRRTGDGIPRRPKLLYSGRFQAAGRAGVRASSGGQWPVRFDGKEIGAGRSGAERDCGKRNGSAVTLTVLSFQLPVFVFSISSDFFQAI